MLIILFLLLFQIINIDLRYYGTTSKPHPNAKIIAGMIRNNLMELGYDFRD